MSVGEQTYIQKYRRKYPWLKCYENAHQRCNGENQRYKQLGRKCFLTKEDVKFLWFRDKAYTLKQPSIDRINNAKDYLLDNCRFIELVENAKQGPKYRIYKKGKDFDGTIIVNRKPVMQYTLKEKFVRRYNSIKDAAKAMGVNPVSISFAVSHRRGTMTSCGFIWKFTNP